MPETATLLGHLESMRRIRFFEEEVARLRAVGDVVGSVHLCNGQEAVCTGACAALDLSRDAVFPTYRGHGWTLACGAPPYRLFAELLGRETGINGGRGGSAYLTAPGYGMYGEPVIFLVENNHYSELTPIADMVRVDRLYKRASAYGIPGARLDGNDPAAVRAAVAEAAHRARSGEGPVLLEAMTQRLVGQYIGDAQQYRPEGELDEALAGEPITRLLAVLRRAGVAEAELDEGEARERAEIAEASGRAPSDPLSDPTTVLEHLYA